MPATLKDIANYTGVSCTTVSNVIHGRSGRVSAETIAKIEAAIKELNYVPNMSARTLVSSSSKVIAFINHADSQPNSNFMDDPFQSSFVGIIEAILREHGYFLMLRTVATSNDLKIFLRNWNVDGLFVTGVFRNEFFDTLTTLSLPVVLIDSYVHHPAFCNVGLEDFAGSKLATSYLIKRGHHKIAFVSPLIQDGGVLQERFFGYKTALAEAGIPFDEQLVIQYCMDLDSMIKLSCELAKVDGLTAVVTTADIMAAGLMTGFRQQGIRVPEDISVIGFDDLNISRMITPPLTTIHQDMPLKVQKAVEFMIQRLEGTKLTETEVILPVRLIERESVRTL